MLNSATLRRAHRMLPDPISVTITPQNPIAAATANVRAYRRPWSTDELRAFGAEIGLEIDRAVFLIPVEAMATIKATWKITDSDATWTIRSKALELADTIHRCTCTKDV